MKVRILADQLFSFNSLDLLDELSRVSPNLQVRLYNPTFHKSQTQPLEFAAGIVCCFARFNQRMHNKVLLVDDSIGITGGRNYEDRYFNWDDSFDYVDRDVMVGGPAAKKMAASFCAVLASPAGRAADPSARRQPTHRRRSAASPVWPAPHYRQPQRVAQLQRGGGRPGLAEGLAGRPDAVGQQGRFLQRPAGQDRKAQPAACARFHPPHHAHGGQRQA